MAEKCPTCGAEAPVYERQGDDVQCKACWRKWAETAVCEHCKAIVVDLRFHDVQGGNYVEPHYECGIGGPEWDPGYRTPECWQRQVDALQAAAVRTGSSALDALRHTMQNTRYAEPWRDPKLEKLRGLYDAPFGKVRVVGPLGVEDAEIEELLDDTPTDGEGRLT